MIFVPRRGSVALFAVGAARPLGRARRRLLAGAVLPAVLLVPLVAGCSASNGPDGTSAAPVPSATATEPEVPAVQNATDLNRKPISAAGKGTPPTKLVTTDLVTGTGATATATSTVKIQYAGVLWRNGEEFDSSWANGQPATFPLDGTIPGFGQGIDGMKVGGRRQIIIPPDLGYGPMGGRPPVILADDTLVFVVDLVGVAAPAGGSSVAP